jgi:hypothetical protein
VLHLLVVSRFLLLKKTVLVETRNIVYREVLDAIRE